MYLIAATVLGLVQLVIGAGDQAFWIVASLGEGEAKGGGDAVDHLVSAAYFDP